MPKGDRERLKADPEDGTTPIAHLLLEAVAIANLSGKKKGALLYLWRRTYDWQINGNRLKEAIISLEEWAKVFNTDKRHTSSLLKDLEAHRIILRRFIGPGKGYYYAMNTRVAEWGNGCINQQQLHEIANLPLPKKATVPLPKTATPLDTNLALRKDSIKSNLNKEEDIDRNINLIYKENGELDEHETIIYYQSLWKIRRILSGKIEATKANKERYRRELKRLGIPDK